jgi:hypothetical protein
MMTGINVKTNVLLLCTLILLSARFAGGVLDADKDGLLLHLDFNGDGSNIAHDRSGNDNHAELNGPSWKACVEGNALYFDGINDYAFKANASALDFSSNNEITLAAWFRLDGHSGQDGILSINGDDCCVYRIMVDSDMHPVYDAGEHKDQAVPEYVFVQGVWYHYVLTVRGGGNATVYINGKQVHRSSEGVSEYLPAGREFFVGCGEVNWLHHTEGVIDEVRVYDRVLSEEEVSSLYGESRPPCLEKDLASKVYYALTTVISEAPPAFIPIANELYSFITTLDYLRIFITVVVVSTAGLLLVRLSKWPPRVILTQREAVLLFFVVYLFVGLTVYVDYGVSYDEESARNFGVVSFNYVFNGDTSLLTYHDRVYGVATELPLIIIEKLLGLTDSRDIFLMRHLCTFLLFYISVYFFYLLCAHHFGSWRIGVLGSLFLITSPRIFADSFYNPKDIPFLSIFIIAVYTLVAYLEDKTLLKASLHAITCAVLIDVRIPGVLALFLTVLFVGFDIVVGVVTSTLTKKKTIEAAFSLLAYVTLTSFFVVLLWPYLWSDPLHNFIYALETMSYFPYYTGVLYLGQYLSPNNLPWHYIPVWLAITTPPMYILLFFAGLVALVISARGLFHPVRFYLGIKEGLIFACWFFLPLLVVIALKSILYNGWRHLFFIYPAFLIIGLRGLVSLLEFLRLLEGKVRLISQFILTFMVVSGLVFTLQFMVENHPYENVYFNMLAGGMQSAKKNFDLDYWQLSSKQALEYILGHDNGTTIRVHVLTYPYVAPVDKILPPEDRARLAGSDDADYWLSTYAYHEEEYPYGEEFYSAKVGGAKIAVVYKPELLGSPIRDWLVCGAFQDTNGQGFDTDYIRESNITPVLGGECGSLHWHDYSSDKGLVDFLHTFIPNPEQAVAYASTYIHSPEDASVDFWYGSDDGAKIWLNNALVHTNHVNRGTTCVTDRVPLNLKAGWNKLLIKVDNNNGEWKLYARIKQDDLKITINQA